MSKEALTHSDRYIRKTNRIILLVGIISMLVFLFGLALMSTEDVEEEKHVDLGNSITDETSFDVGANQDNSNEIILDDGEEIERPITLEPNPINMGQVVIGTPANNVLTIGTNSKSAIKIISVDLEDAASEGFSFENHCNGKELRAGLTCTVTMNWLPSMPFNFQNNFKIIWHETNVADKDAKHDEVPVYGNAVKKDECNFCDNGTSAAAEQSAGKNMRLAIGPDGSVIGYIDEDGIVHDFNGNVIGKVNSDGWIVDKDGNVIGVASNGRLIMDENGNVIGYVDADGVAHNLDGSIMGTVLSDGTVVDENGKTVGKAIATGYVYDKDGNIIGRVLEDGTVVDLDGNVIGRVDENGNVVDFDGNIIGHVAKAGEVVFDDEGNAIGIVVPDGSILDEDGNVVGYMGDDGNAYKKNLIGKKGASVQLAVDKDGNVIGYIDENGVVRDFNGNIIGHVDENGNIVDENGNIIGKASDMWRDLALDKDGNIIGYIDEKGLVRDANGKIIGYVDENGNIIGNALSGSRYDVQKKGNAARLAYDKDGNVIGFIDENGVVRDFNGNIIGHVDENGNIVDENGNIIGTVNGHPDKWVDLALDSKGNVVGYVDENKNVYDENGNLIGIMTTDGKVYNFFDNLIGQTNENKEVVDDSGNVLGVMSGYGSLAKDKEDKTIGYIGTEKVAIGLNKEVAGYVDGNGILRDFSGAEKGVSMGEYPLIVSLQRQVVGYVYEDKAFDFSGKLLGTIEGSTVKNNSDMVAQVVDAEQLLKNDKGKVVAYTQKSYVVYDADNAIMGYVRENGNVFNETGEEIGLRGNYVDLASKIGRRELHIGYQKNDMFVPLDDENSGDFLGYKGDLVRLAYDENGNVIGYIDSDGNVYDFNGNLIGQVDENGNITDADGNVIGKAGKIVNLALDENGKIIGYVDEDGVLRDINGNIIGYSTGNGKLYSLGTTKIGSLLNKELIPINPEGMVLGTVNNRGEVVKDKKVVGRMRPNGLVYDKKGEKVVAVGILPGFIAGWGCDFEGKLGKDGVVRYAGSEVDYRIYADGTVWRPDGTFAGRTMITGNVYDDECNYLGAAAADGIVRDANRKPIGCINPDGKVLDLEDARVIGHTVTNKNVVSHNYTEIGRLDNRGILRDNKNNPVGCMNSNNEVFDKDRSYLGFVPDVKYAFDLKGNMLGVFDIAGNIKIKGVNRPHLFVNNLIADGDNNIIGFASPSINVITNSEGKIVGNLFPNGRVYDKDGASVGIISGDGFGIYNDEIGISVPLKQVVDMDGNVVGFVNYDMSVINTKGIVVGKVNGKGQMFDAKNRQTGGIVKQGGARGYNGVFLGYITADGNVIETQNVKNGQDNVINRGEITGNYVPDGHIVRSGSLIGEMVPSAVVIDLFGKYAGYSNQFGEILDKKGQWVTNFLPGDVNNSNVSVVPRGAVIDYAGSIIGIVLPNGQFLARNNEIGGYVLPDGKVINNDGKLLGETISGDIVIGNDDKVKGFVDYEGKVMQNGSQVGKMLTDDLAVDNNNNVLGHAFDIGNTILSNKGEYIGRLTSTGKVLDAQNNEIGYVKSNGSFIDGDKNVAGYILPEVAKNRRN